MLQMIDEYPLVNTNEVDAFVGNKAWARTMLPLYRLHWISRNFKLFFLCSQCSIETELRIRCTTKIFTILMGIVSSQWIMTTPMISNHIIVDYSPITAIFLAGDSQGTTQVEQPNHTLREPLFTRLQGNQEPIAAQISAPSCIHPPHRSE